MSSEPEQRRTCLTSLKLARPVEPVLLGRRVAGLSAPFNHRRTLPAWDESFGGTYSLCVTPAVEARS